MSLDIILVSILAGYLCLFYLLRRSGPRPLPPGPLGVPLLGSIPLLGPAPHRSLHGLSKRYGPLMYLRVGVVPTVVVSDAATAEQFLRTHDVAFANRPDSEIFRCISYGLKGFAFAEYGAYWRNIRKLCVTHLLSAPKISSLGPARREEIHLFVKSMADAAETRAAVNVSEAMGELVSDIACRMIVGRKFKEDDEDGKMFRAKTSELMKLMSAFNVNDFIPLLGAFDLQGIRKKMKAVHEGFDKLLEKIVDEHLANKGERRKSDEKDFVDVMLELMERDEVVEGVRFDRTTVKAIVLDMLEASMDTTRTSIEWALSELIRHPRIMRKAQQELETVVGRDREVEEPDLPKLKYLGMIVKETLRLHPLTAFLFHRGKQECEVGGFLIPKGANVMISLWALGRDTAVWPDVEEFKPERFADNGIDFRGDFRLLSFGSGRRMCAGMQLALVVYPLILAQMIHCFDWELPEGQAAADLDMNESYGFTMPRAKPLWAVPTKRLHGLQI